MRTIIMVAAAFVLGGLVTTCSPSGSSAPEAYAQLPGGERIVGVESIAGGPESTRSAASILLVRPDGSFRRCHYYQSGDDRWLCSSIPAIPST